RDHPPPAHLTRLRAPPRPPNDAITREHGGDGERPQPEHVTPAHEQRRPEHRPPQGTQPSRQGGDRLAHFPGPRGADRRTDGGLDAVRGAEPVGEGDVARVVGRRAVVGRSWLTRHRRGTGRRTRPTPPRRTRDRAPPRAPRVRGRWRRGPRRPRGGTALCPWPSPSPAGPRRTCRSTRLR